MSATTDNVFTYEHLVLAGQAHPIRIAVLMVMGEDLEKRWSPSDMTEELKSRKVKGRDGAVLTLGAVSYHFRTLHTKRWITRTGAGRVRGAIETYYRIDGRRV